MGSNGTGPSPARLAVATMSPPPRARSAGIAACMPNTTPSRFTPMAIRYRSRSKSSSKPHPVATPALRNAMSSPPNRSTAAATAASLSAGSLTSQRTNTPPASWATRSPTAVSTSATTTDVPSPASRRAAAAPNPPAPPVISATLPSNPPFVVDTSPPRGCPARPRVPYGRSPHCIGREERRGLRAERQGPRVPGPAAGLHGLARVPGGGHVRRTAPRDDRRRAGPRAPAGRRGAQGRGPPPRPVEPVPPRLGRPGARPLRPRLRAPRRADGAEPGDRPRGHELRRARHRQHGGAAPVRLAGTEGAMAPAAARRRDPELLRHDRARRGQLGR